MRWAVAMMLLVGSSYFLYQEYRRQVIAELPEQLPPEPVAEIVKKRPILTPAEMEKVRASTRNPDPTVRWTALELLNAFGDPQTQQLLERAIANDPDIEVRVKAVKLLRSLTGHVSVPSLVKGLRTVDVDGRISAIQALVELGDPAAVPWLAEVANNDANPRVRVEALKALGIFQDKRYEEFNALTARLRAQYEAAVAKSQETGK